MLTVPILDKHLNLSILKYLRQSETPTRCFKKKFPLGVSRKNENFEIFMISQGSARPRLKILSLNNETETENVEVSITRPRPRLKSFESQ